MTRQTYKQISNDANSCSLLRWSAPSAPAFRRATTGACRCATLSGQMRPNVAQLSGFSRLRVSSRFLPCNRTATSTFMLKIIAFTVLRGRDVVNV